MLNFGRIANRLECHIRARLDNGTLVHDDPAYNLWQDAVTVHKRLLEWEESQEARGDEPSARAANDLILGRIA